ncbi:N-terminal acetyltransferase A complex auxiliary subunit NAA15 [Cocos nucifera]|uniref:N-terminal acetyltransferase A complex auxiliary subunit NAA15 n=1 Tax=Cocos nucifera TaxID=13894 RepID=A0A8K0IVG7_COCNU|nr:N-terminal acetyltransferase A complex auxiliary subunit NAA15 [Cocos nucifera]
MKGLTLNCMDRKSEAYELVRRGLKNDLKSHVCWHVYGLLYRSDREYREAIKCYRNALKIDPDNIEILRDLSLLQAQMRDLTGFIETRQQLLTLKPNHRMNWIGFAVSHHLSSKLNETLIFCFHYELNHQNILSYLIFLFLLCMSVSVSKAIEILEAYEGTLEDDYPPDNERYEHGEMLLYKISLLEERGLLEKALEEMEKKEAKIVDKLAYKEQMASILVKLGFLEEGEKIYRSLLFMNSDNYRYFIGLQKCLGLYSENGQYTSDEIERLDALYKSLKEQYSWSSAVKDTKGASFNSYVDSAFGFPAVIRPLYLVQHYDRWGQHDIALAKMDEAIEHTPTAIDLYSVKGRILKHAGDLAAAASLADEARSMDLADRYLNSECVMRMLQADQVGLAERTAVLFTKDGDQHNNLHDMQCMWYELASGESYFRQGDLGGALKKFLAVEKHYADMTEDQFDFHSYCLRKMTLRAYVSMLKFQDKLHSHEYFHKAAAGAIRCYMKLHDSPIKATTEEGDEMSKLPPSQRKKLRQKQKKAEARAKKEAEEKTEEASSGTSKPGKRQHTRPVDLDPHGEKLLQAVKQLLKLDENNHDCHRCLIRFLHKVSSFPAPVTDSEILIRSVLEAELPKISQSHGKSLVEVNQSFLEKHKDSLMHRAAAAEMLLVLEPEKKLEAIKLIEDSTNKLAPVNGVLGPVREWKLEDCIAVHKLLETVFIDEDAASRWKARCMDYFPYSTYFGGCRSSAVAFSVNHNVQIAPENGVLAYQEAKSEEPHSLNGKLHAFKNLTI